MASKWFMIDSLGQGSFGSVYLAQPKPSALSLTSSLPPFVAIKFAPRNQSRSLESEKSILYELRECPEIVHCLDDYTYTDDLVGTEYYNIVLEYADGGTLKKLLKSRGGILPEREASWFAFMLLKGLSHVHQKGYVHCDVKPSNVLVFNISSGQCERALKHNLKLADFGLAKKAGKKTNWRGTLLYSSPESVANNIHEAPMDIWALGCIVVDMLIGKGGLWNRYNGDDWKCLAKFIASYEDKMLSLLLPELDNLSENAKDFVGRCLAKNVGERWTADQLLKHPFITQNQMLLHMFEGRLQNMMEYVCNSQSGSSTKLSQNALGVC